jgi:hypothetical protein
LAASIAAMILLVSSGSALILAAQGGPEESSAGQKIVSEYQSSPFLPIAPVPSGSNTGYTPNTQAAPQNSDLEGIRDAVNNTTPIVDQGTAPRMNGNGTLTAVPGGNQDPGVRPVNPVPGGFNPTGLSPNNTGGGTHNGDPDPTVVNNGNGGDRGMIVDVKPSAGSGNNGGSNVTAEDRGAQIDTLIRVAREQQVLGNFAKAATAYEQALALGASPASTNQRLAQCYEKLNRKADAIKAYERAILAFEKLDQNDVRVQAQLDSCRQALKLLRGN